MSPLRTIFLSLMLLVALRPAHAADETTPRIAIAQIIRMSCPSDAC